MFGFSKEDKKELLEYPQKFGVILHGMHKDLTRMQYKVDEYKEVSNNHIRYSKDFEDKFENEIRNVNQMYSEAKLLIERFKEHINFNMSSIDSKVTSYDNLFQDSKNRYEDFKKSELSLQKIINENNKILEYRVLSKYEDLKSELHQFNLMFVNSLEKAQIESKNREALLKQGIDKNIKHFENSILDTTEALRFELQQDNLVLNNRLEKAQIQISNSQKDLQINRWLIYILGTLLLISFIIYYK